MDGTVLEKLQVIISASTKPLRDELKKVNSSVKNTASSVNKQTSAISGAFKKIGGTIAAAMSVKTLVSFGKSCIELGSDLAEVQNVVDVTFGKASEEINKFAKNAITQFGLSETSAKRYSSTMGAMLKSMGISSDAVLDMSKNLTGLSADMASFYNLSSDEAFAKIRSGISGETEPLKQLGINMSVANLEAYALSQGINKSYNSMTQAEQATLRYNYLLSVTKDAQGDFARTSDSWANQTRILAESFNSVKASIGQGLINVFTPVIRIINKFISRLAVAAQTFQAFTEKIFGKSGSSSAGGLPSELADAADETSDISGAMADTAKSAKEAKGALAGFDKLNNRSSSSDSSSGSGVGAGSGAYASALENSVDTDSFADKAGKSLDKLQDKVKRFTTIFKSTFGSTFSKIATDGKRNFNVLKNNITRVWSDLKTLKSPIKNWFTNDYVPYLQTMGNYIAVELDSCAQIFNTVFGSVWSDFIFPVFSNFITVGLPMITQFKTEALNTMTIFCQNMTDIFIMLWQEGVSPALQTLSTIWTDTVNTLADTWNTYGQAIFDGINEAINNTAKLFKETWEKWIKPVWDKFIETINKVWKDHMQPFLANILSFVAEVIDCGLMIYNNFIAPIVSWVVDILAPIITGVANAIFDKISVVVGGIINFINGIITTLRGIIEFIKGVFTGDWSLAWDGIKNIFKGIWDSFVELAKAPLNLLIGTINTFIAGAEGAINVLIRGLNHISIDVPDWVPKIGGKKYGVSLNDVSFSRIEYLAKGGVVNSPTLSVIGEAGREAVVPLENNTGWMDSLATYLSAKMDNTGVIAAINNLTRVVGDGNIYLTAEMDGDIVYKSVVKRNKQHIKQTGKSEFVY